MEGEVTRLLGEYEGYPAADGMRAIHLLLTSRHDEARGVLRRRMAAGIGSIPRDSEWLEAVWNLSEAAAALGELDAVDAFHAALVPYADLWVVDGIGAACFGVVAHHLGRLSRALERYDDARRWLDAATEAHLSAGASRLARSSAELLRSIPGQPARPRKRPEGPAAGMLTRAGALWHLEWQGNATTVRHSKGILDIARLLERPGDEIHVLDLVAPGAGGQPGGGAGPMLDDKAKRAYQRRLRDLEEEIDDATTMADDARVARLEHERDLVVSEISRAYGLGGRPRTVADPAERARKAVGMRIATALRAIAAADVDLGRHLDHSIVTGRYCSYQPETETRWEVSARGG
jgi:hypothetical protein